MALLVLAGAGVGILLGMRSCAEGCSKCWNSENGLFKELMNTAPECVECKDELLIGMDSRSCVSECGEGSGPVVNEAFTKWASASGESVTVA